MWVLPGNVHPSMWFKYAIDNTFNFSLFDDKGNYENKLDPRVHAAFLLRSSSWLVSFAAVILLVTLRSSPTNGCSLELCIPFPLLLRTNDMHVTVRSYTNHISHYICHQRSRFPRYGSLILIGQFKERNAELG